MSIPKLRVESAVKWRSTSGSASSGRRGGVERASSAGTAGTGRSGAAPRARGVPGCDFS